MSSALKGGKKTMSSRLMSMKFMQRATAALPVKRSAQSEEPPNKRMKVADNVSANAPVLGNQSTDPSEGTSKQGEAMLARQAELAGDTKWSLSTAQSLNVRPRSRLNVVTAGYNMIDAASGSESDEEETAGATSGRIQFGGPRSMEQAQGDQQNADRSDDSSRSHSDDEGNSSGDQSDSYTSQRGNTKANDRADEIKDVRRSSSKDTGPPASLLAERQRNEHKKMNAPPRSISSGGRSKSGISAARAFSQMCYNCGEKGHRKQDCPRAKAQRTR